MRVPWLLGQSAEAQRAMAAEGVRFFPDPPPAEGEDAPAAE